MRVVFWGITQDQVQLSQCHPFNYRWSSTKKPHLQLTGLSGGKFPTSQAQVHPKRMMQALLLQFVKWAILFAPQVKMCKGQLMFYVRQPDCFDTHLGRLQSQAGISSGAAFKSSDALWVLAAHCNTWKHDDRVIVRKTVFIEFQRISTTSMFHGISFPQDLDLP